jgi:hypothetical protein
MSKCEPTTAAGEITGQATAHHHSSPSAVGKRGCWSLVSSQRRRDGPPTLIRKCLFVASTLRPDGGSVGSISNRADVGDPKPGHGTQASRNRREPAVIIAAFASDMRRRETMRVVRRDRSFPRFAGTSVSVPGCDADSPFSGHAALPHRHARGLWPAGDSRTRPIYRENGTWMLGRGGIPRYSCAASTRAALIEHGTDRGGSAHRPSECAVQCVQ